MNIHYVSKMNATLTMAITLSILDQYAKFLHSCKERKISNKTHISLPMIEQRIPNIDDLNERLIAVWSEVISDTAIDRWRKRLQACVHANGGHFKTFYEQTHANNWHFYVFLVQVASAHGLIFYCVGAWWFGRQASLNCKASPLLKAVNKQKINCYILHNANICTYFRDIRHIFNMFYVCKNCIIFYF